MLFKKLLSDISSFFDKSGINDFMNDADRGPGHGIMQGAFYGLIFLAIGSLLKLFIPLWAVGVCIAILAAANHARVLYEELVLEDWKSRPKEWDFYFDGFFRPMQTDAVASLIFIPLWAVCPWIIFALLLGFKRKDEKPFFLGWRK